MELSEESLTLTAKEGAVLQGSFTVSHPQEKKMKGFVYSSDPRMLVQPREFHSSSALIRYQIDTAGLCAGERAEGAFTVCSELGEKEVPFTVTVTGGGQKEAPAPLSIAALEEKAREDFEAGAALFASDSFRQKVREEKDDVRTLYSVLMEEDPHRGLEEFLIGCGKKEPVELSLSSSQIRISEPSGTVLETVNVQRGGWGYLEAKITSDARFLRPEKQFFTTQDFIGSTFELRYIVDANLLHAGKNYGRITVETSYQTLALDVCIDQGTHESARLHRVRQLMIRKVIRLYLDYRLGRMDLRQWAEHTMSVTGGYRRAGGEDVYADLADVFVLLSEDKKAAAEHLLRTIENHQERLKDVSRYAVFLYLSTFFTRDGDYVNQVRGKIRRLYLENRSAWLIRWLQLYLLEDECGGDSGKLDLITKQIAIGSRSPVLYLEGALIITRTPWLVHEWTQEIRCITDYALRANLADEKLMLQVSGLICKKPVYDPVTFRLLKRMWEKSGMKDVLEAWTAVAIAGQKKNPAYFPLYEMAVRSDLQITGLYEYYMETMGEVRIEKMPEVIRRYFMYNEALSWHKRAEIYRSVADARERIPQTFRTMRQSLEKFLIDQLAQERVDKNLALLYDTFLTPQLLTLPLARKLVRVLFTFEIGCRNPLMKKVIIADDRLTRRRVADITDHKALVRIYSESSRILLQDENGRYYSSTSLYLAEHLLDSERLMRLCMQLAPMEMHLVLFQVLNTKAGSPVTHQTLPMFLEAVQMSALSEDYRERVRSFLLDYYAGHPEEETLFHFLKNIDLEEYARIDRRKLMALLTERGFYEQAYQLLEKYGCEDVPLPLQVRICSQSVLQREYEQNDTLLSLCYRCFASGKYDEHVLIYLAMYYEGPVRAMKQLWNVAREYGVDTLNLERKILGMIIFSRTGTSGSENIYVSFRRQLGNRRLSQAYVILRSYEYLVKGEPVSELVFDDILADYEHGGKLPDVCALALLQYLSGVVQRKKNQDKAAQELLETYSLRSIRFAFYRNFPQEMIGKLGIEDKVFLECVANPESTVRLYYRPKHRSVPYKEELMRNVFEGIRVREFVLFGDEVLECYTEETRPDGEKRRSGCRTLRAGQIPDLLIQSKFGRISEMTRLIDNGCESAFLDAYEEYRQADSLTREIFTLV